MIRRRASAAIRPGNPYAPGALKAKDDPVESTSNIPVQDTTTCVVADRWGNVVAATPSANLVGNQPGPSGVTQGNRVRSLNTTPGHPNRVQPGKRPRITLTPTLVLKDDKPVLAISVAGGDLQDQTSLNMILNHVEFGMFPEQAVTAPRVSTHFTIRVPSTRTRTGSLLLLDPAEMRVNKAVSADVLRELEERGHKVSTTGGAIAYPVMIYIDHGKKMIHAAGDPKAGRHAAAID